MPDPNDPEPDSVEKGIRFGCGFVFGAFTAILLVLRLFAAWRVPFWALAAAVGIACGLLAMRHGDNFWRSIFKWNQWF